MQSCTPARLAVRGLHWIQQYSLRAPNLAYQTTVPFENKLDFFPGLLGTLTTARQVKAAKAIEQTAGHEHQRHSGADGFKWMIVNVVGLGAMVIHNRERTHISMMLLV